MSEVKLVKSGALILRTYGEYSDFGVTGVFRVERDIEIPKLESRLAHQWDQTDSNQKLLDEFWKKCVTEGAVTAVDYYELHSESDSATLNKGDENL